MLFSRFSFFILCAVLFSACSNGDIQTYKEDKGDFKEVYERRKSDLKKHGQYQKFTKDKILIEESNYQDDLLHGEQKLFDLEGNPQASQTMNMGKFDGPYKSWFADGQLESEGNYVNDEMTGEWKFFYPNGQLSQVVNFVANQEEGPFKEYHKNGKMKAEGAYKGGDNEHGLLTLYDENGEPERKMECNAGVCITIWTPEK